MDELIGKCQEVMGKIMNVDPSLIKDDTSPENLLEWDSLAHTQLILELEKTFSISISPDEAIDLETFKMIHEHVNSKLNAD